MCLLSWDTPRWELTLATSLYWVGLYEAICSKKWEWFFQVDLTPTICYSFLRFVGGGEYITLNTLALPVLTRANKSTVLGALFALQGTLAITSLCSIPVFLLAHFIPRIVLDIWLVVYVCFTLGAHYSLMKVSLLVRLVPFKVDTLNVQTRRLRGWVGVRQYTAHLQTYGLAAPLSEQHGEARITFSMLAPIPKLVI